MNLHQGISAIGVGLLLVSIILLIIAFFIAFERHDKLEPVQRIIYASFACLLAGAFLLGAFG